MKTLTEIMAELDNAEKTANYANEGDFNHFTPFDDSAPLPEFPFVELSYIMPEVIDFICAAANSIQAPLDLVGSSVLAVLEIAQRGKFPVTLPSGHKERACFYIAPIAPPSERKSGVIETVCRPLIEFETEYNLEHGADFARSESELRQLKGRMESAEREAINAVDKEEHKQAQKKLLELGSELSEYKPLSPLRLYGADVTPEKLAAMIKSQNEVFALISAEGGGLFENIGRYSDKGGLEIYLNGYSGDRICIDRKTSASVVIECPTLSILAPCQPSVINELFSDKQKSGRGLLSRILFVSCNSMVGQRKAISSPIPEPFYNNYKNLCKKILETEYSGDLQFSDEAFAHYKAFFDEIEPKLSPDSGELFFIADWVGKLHGNMARFAGLLHCIVEFTAGRNPVNSRICADEAKAAVILSRYFLAHAKEVYKQQSEPREITNARYLWSKIRFGSTITKNELYHKTQGKKNFNLDESLAVLALRGYIRIDYIKTGGRPSEQIVINPEAKR